MENLVKGFLKQKNFAIAGSFRNESKYAYRIFEKLKKKGRKVFPINPKGGQVEGVKCYPNIKDILDDIDVITIVTPPKVTEQLVKDCKDKGVTRVWMQPGAESAKAISFCNENNIDVIYGLCIILKAI